MTLTMVSVICPSFNITETARLKPINYHIKHAFITYFSDRCLLRRNRNLDHPLKPVFEDLVGLLDLRQGESVRDQGRCIDLARFDQ